MKNTINFVLILISFISTSNAQNFKNRFETIDVQNYKLAIEVSDTTNRITASMNIALKFKKNSTEFILDFIKKDSTGKGMLINSIYENDKTATYLHENNQLKIYPNATNTDSIFNYTITYEGIPKDGLIICNNLYGDRTFFGDNWPNRAQNWFPCVDHPSDKATIEYIITAPNHYQAIANGFEVEETNLDNNLKQYNYKTNVPLPTKVMVIGIAKFAVQNIGETHDIPVSTWVYPQTKEKGFYDFSTAKEVLNFFIENIGEYPFEKLANVQSKTRFGGMENAGNIFYFEKSVTGNREHEDLIAHEIAHQWFGNSASELDWPHIWLSEGFATYFTNLYIQKSLGEEALQKRLSEEKAKVIAFHKYQQTPIIDYTSTNLMSILNPNSYQKGSWFLRMLHHKLGDETFWKGIQLYYQTYKFKNATTDDFRNTMETVSNSNLEDFFHNWLGQSGHPTLKPSWIYHKNKLRLIIDQVQESNFTFPLDIALLYKDGTSEIKTIQVNTKFAPHEIETNGEVIDIKLDPNNYLLFEIIKD
ncbi:M1 family metallopeptidase [Lutibacter maritimus]|uniref:Aminopeptidase N n=1 Tax=Lutibacter maritimus TaxID=593133 RepID=A0A1I6Q6Y9_9FLAO|nr:M1 family metallopeptidase [Lutibacter maritimus]SFS48192.1 Peptidase family M1 [Lutibacter maritimus]